MYNNYDESEENILHIVISLYFPRKYCYNDDNEPKPKSNLEVLMFN